MEKFLFDNDVQELMEQGRISGNKVSELRERCEHAVDVMEQCRQGETRVLAFASAPDLDLSDPLNPRWREFMVGKFKFRLEFVSVRQRYVVSLAAPPPPPRRRSQGAALKAPRIVQRRTGGGKVERSLIELYNLAWAQCVTVWYGAILPSLRDSFAVLRLVVARAKVQLRQLGDDLPFTAEQRSVAAALQGLLAPQNAASYAAYPQAREIVRFGDGIRLELGRFVSVSPLLPWVVWETAPF